MADRLVFRRYGRSYHMVLEDAADLRHAAGLDEAHWVATSAPLPSLRADPLLLDLLDLDDDQRVKVGEFKTAIRWLLAHLADPAGIAAGSDRLAPAAVNPEAPDGSKIRQALEKMLARSGSGATEVGLSQLRTLRRQLEQQPVSGVGVILPDAGADAERRAFLQAILDTVGGVGHPGGGQGVDTDRLDAFCEEARRYLAWYRKGALPDGRADSDILPLGSDTGDAFTAFAAVRDKVDQYFAQCEALSLDSRLKEQIWPHAAAAPVEGLADVESIRALLKTSPVAEPNAERELRFDGWTNPFYAEGLERLRRRVIVPLLGRETDRLSGSDWAAIRRRWAPYEAWQAERQGASVAELGVETLERYLSGHLAEAVKGQILESAARGYVLENVRLAEKLALYQANLLRIANNFVSFPDLYAAGRRALFEEGTLVMDGRRFNLAVRVPDRAEHLKSTERGAMFVMYCALAHHPSGRTAEVALPVTAGSQGNLVVGKRGVFQHVDGTEWSAQVMQIVDRPISLREAILEPFKRLGAAITNKIESITATAEKQMEKAGTQALSAAPPPAPVSAAAPGQPGMGGVLAGGGIAVAALGSSLAFITKTLAELHWWQVLSGVGGAVLAVLVPTVVVAILRLRARDLSCILEGSGWAVNARMRLTRGQRCCFTERPRYPAGARMQRGARWWFWRGLAVALCLAAAWAAWR